jgi:hypothetical protein
MPTECSASLFDFARVAGRQVVAGFDGGAITSDAGALLLGSTDRAIRMTERFAAASPIGGCRDWWSTASARWSCNACSASRSATRT